MSTSRIFRIMNPVFCVTYHIFHKSIQYYDLLNTHFRLISTLKTVVLLNNFVDAGTLSSSSSPGLFIYSQSHIPADKSPICWTHTECSWTGMHRWGPRHKTALDTLSFFIKSSLWALTYSTLFCSISTCSAASGALFMNIHFNTLL